MRKIVCIAIVFLMSISTSAQVEKTSQLYKTLKVNDSIIFNASFITCNLKELTELVTDDLEFYHDKAGLMGGKDTFIENTKNGLCKSKHKLRRVLEKGTLEVFSLKNTKGFYDLVDPVSVKFEGKFYEREKIYDSNLYYLSSNGGSPSRLYFIPLK